MRRVIVGFSNCELDGVQSFANVYPWLDYFISKFPARPLPIASTHPQSHFHSHHALSAPPPSLLLQPAEQVAPDLIGCLLVKRQPSGELLWGVIVETEAYSQDDPATRGYRRRSPSNKTLFGERGRLIPV